MNAIIFDCDGVLVDSEKWSCSAWLPVLARRGIQAELADIELFIGKSDRAVIDYYQEREGMVFPSGIVDEREREFFSLARDHLQSFTDLRQTLELLRNRGIALAVASSGRHEKIRFSLDQVGLTEFFQVVCSATEVAHGKPAPDLFLLAASRLGVDPPDCAVVEDSIFGIRAARSAGMKALGFTSSYPAADLLAAGADATFDSYDEFPALLTAANE